MEQVYNRFDPARQFDRIDFRADRILQSAELNELQSASRHRLQGITDLLFKDGDVVRDARVIVDASSGQTLCEAGVLYLAGAVRGVAPATLHIATKGLVTIGVYLRERSVSELDDESLYNPAVGTRGYQEPGALRHQMVPEWGVSGGEGAFYPVYVVDDGLVRTKEAPPQLDAVTQALARYDRDSAGGHYVIHGLAVARAADHPDGAQVYTVSEGRARVNGYGVELGTSRRVIYPARPDLRHIANEPHASATAAAQRIRFDRSPAANITALSITAERTVTLTHGAFAGAADPLPDNSVLELRSVKQLATVYEIGKDCKLSGGTVDWSPAGAEPAPGSTYQVTYRYISNAEPTDVDATGCTVAGAVPGTLVLVSYNQMLPRIDRLVLDAEGGPSWLQGVAADWNPQPPAVPFGVLGLATVQQRWTAADRQLVNDAVRVVPMNDLAAVSGKIDRVWSLLAQERLKGDIHLREAGAKKGLFVDPFLDNEMRDAGVPQTAAIIRPDPQGDGGVLTLPIVSADVLTPDGDVPAPAALPHAMTTLLQQLLRTDSMKVNPYMAFEPMPVPFFLTPAVDHWSERRTAWSSTQITEVVSGISSQQFITRIGSTRVEAAEFLRPIVVAFRATDFGPGEIVTTLTFDGIDVMPPGPPLVANAQGIVAGSIQIPDGVPAGAKRVLIAGNASRGEAVFTGSGEVTIDTTIAVRQMPPGVDPLAQTFTLQQPAQIGAVDLWFSAKGPTRVLVQIRETQLGFPTRSVLAEVSVPVAQIRLGGQATRVDLGRPVALQADTEYALVVLCDDATSALGVGVLGQFDVDAQQWITAQPYNVGVLLSSANASTWTPHQDRDLAFRLLRCSYTSQTRTLDLGAVDVDGATDLMLFAAAEVPSSRASISYSLSLPGGDVVEVAHGQPVRLPAPVTGSVGIGARLGGMESVSAVLHPGTQLLAATVGTTGSYCSRAVPAGPDSRVRVVYDLQAPAGSSVACSLADGTADATAAGSWSAVPVLASRPVGDGWIEITHEAKDIDHLSVRVRLLLAGTSAARPQVRNLRVMVL